MHRLSHVVFVHIAVVFIEDIVVILAVAALLMLVCSKLCTVQHLRNSLFSHVRVCTFAASYFPPGAFASVICIICGTFHVLYVIASERLCIVCAV